MYCSSYLVSWSPVCLAMPTEGSRTTYCVCGLSHVIKVDCFYYYLVCSPAELRGPWGGFLFKLREVATYRHLCLLLSSFPSQPPPSVCSHPVAGRAVRLRVAVSSQSAEGQFCVGWTPQRVSFGFLSLPKAQVRTEKQAIGSSTSLRG